MILTIFDSLNIIFHEYHILLQESTQLKDILHNSISLSNEDFYTTSTSTRTFLEGISCYSCGDVVVGAGVVARILQIYIATSTPPRQ